MRTLKMGEEMSLAERKQHFEGQGQIMARARHPKAHIQLSSRKNNLQNKK